MNTAIQVDQMIAEWKSQGLSKPAIVVNIANACLGWNYIYGDRGEYCTPSHVKSRISSLAKNYPKQSENLKKKCQITNGSGESSCNGCRFYPNGQTRAYDCRGFTYWCFLKGAGITIDGGGATSQYNNNNNWDEKGLIANMPKDKVCCVFRKDSGTGKMEHTLLYDGDGHYIHDSTYVKKCDVSQYKATHYAIPKGLYSEPTPPTPPTPTPTPDPGKAIVTGKNVALRQGPSTSTSVMTRIATGTVVNIATIEGWTYVKFDGKYGFMMNEYIDVRDDSVTVTGRNVALREGTNTSSKVLTRIKTGTVVPRETIAAGWEYIEFGNKKGFMMKQYLNEG